ncbi:MAG: lipid-A-disaccharide synthase [Rickettsiales bacterium]|jgi:lipid-A-disaccharide synthase|nr:lipid-A-disaccharide synthase [Rickettsiales bacterium]
MKKIFIIAGEASGDILGAGIMANMDGVRFVGVGGEEMSRFRGFKSLFNIRDIAVMGLFEVLARFFTIWRRVRQTVAAVVAEKPDMLLSVDSPGFCTAVVKRVKRVMPGLVCVHYVAPQVWAWKPKRARKFARIFNYLLCFFPFERKYFTRHGLRTFAVGHPIAELAVKRAAGSSIVMLPGSRAAMARRLLPVFERAAEIIQAARPGVRIVMPVVATSEKFVRSETARWCVKPKIVAGREARIKAFAECAGAISISGTAVLELAALGVPCVATYKTSPLTYFIAKRLVKIRDVTLPNIILGRRMVAELIQGDAMGDKLAGALLDLIRSPKKMAEYRRDVLALRQAIAPKGGLSPSARAAEILHGILN